MEWQRYSDPTRQTVFQQLGVCERSADDEEDSPRNRCQFSSGSTIDLLDFSFFVAELEVGDLGLDMNSSLVWYTCLVESRATRTTGRAEIIVEFNFSKIICIYYYMFILLYVCDIYFQ